jgi:hypothetical protein
MRGPAAWCAYLGVPKDHPLAGFGYDNIPLSCHGGLTYANEGTGKYLSEDRYWYGWDYGHAGDKFGFEDPKARAISDSFPHENERQWTADEVKVEALDAMWDFKILMKLAEQISSKVLAPSHQEAEKDE